MRDIFALMHGELSVRRLAVGAVVVRCTDGTAVRAVARRQRICTIVGIAILVQSVLLIWCGCVVSITWSCTSITTHILS
jgi:hypothetical protein